MRLAVVLDMDPRFWSADKLDMVTEAVRFFVSALGVSLPYPQVMEIAIIAAFPEKAEAIIVGDWRSIGDLQLKLSSAITRHNSGDSEVYETPIAQGISRALCFAKKSEGRVVVFECSQETTDFSSQSVSISNCGWAAGSIKISVVSLASAQPASALLALCDRTGGVHIPSSFAVSEGELLQALLFHLTASEKAAKVLKTRPQAATQHMGAVCACHNRALDKGYVCSICLSVYCSDSAGICAVCGSRIRREAKDELPLHAQVFSTLFKSESAPCSIFL